jgi:WD40 repeat protein/sterol desaturase/sphingolipid hydroxylase (fatty acid hydroxylase superfamily)
MDWLADLGVSWLYVLGVLTVLAVPFAVLARLMPCNPGGCWWKDLRGAITDVVYWLAGPLVMRGGRVLLFTAGLALLCGGPDKRLLPLEGLPLWQACLAVLLVQDVLLYGMHRLFHTRLGWKFHAVHHSPRVLDWTSTARFHAVNEILSFALADVVVLLLGFSPAVLLVLAPFNVVFSALVHANLNWTFGPLRYVLVSPVFHRWHHTSEEAGLNKNFASTFPVLDLIFGTYYLPAGRLPQDFGNGEPDYPDGFLGQFLHPFRGTSPLAAVVGAAGALAVVVLVGGGIYLASRPADPAEPPAAVAVHAHVPPPAPVADVGEVGEARPLPVAGGSAPVLSVAVSGDGSRAVSASEDGTVKVWDAATGQELLALKGHVLAVHGVAFSGDGSRVVTGSDDRTVRVWDAATGKTLLTLADQPGAVLGVAVSGDGARVASASVDGTLKVWDADTGREVFTLAGDPGATLGVALSADGLRLAWSDGWSARVRDLSPGGAERTLEGHRDLVYSAALSPDGGRAVTGSFDATVKVWDAATGTVTHTLTGHAGPVYSVAASGDGQRIVSGGKDGTVRVWDAVTGHELLSLTGHTDSVTGVAVSADGRRIVSGSRDGTVKVWDAQVSETLP